MAPLAEPALEVVRNGTIKFYPERHAQQVLSLARRKTRLAHLPPIVVGTSDTGVEPLSSRPEWWSRDRPETHDYFREIGLADEVLIRQSDETADWVLICSRSQRADRALEAMNCYYQESPYDKNRFDQFRDVVTSQKAWDLASSIMDGPAADPVRQDPDVLDTWFSSALWPHSTLGWPDNTPELQKYYPTSVLVTARDIITLWVARMVMAGLYNMGKGQRDKGTKGQSAPSVPSSLSPSVPSSLSPSVPQSLSPSVPSSLARDLGLPFSHVSINPTILDGKGERMSKSKGNGVDPVDIIDTHGADALRFTLTQMATETQDARLPVKRDAKGRNTSDKFDVGRNFCNKIWNATRFALSNLATIPAEPVDESKWTIPDRWILSRLMRTIKEADEAIAEYRFDVYAKPATTSSGATSATGTSKPSSRN